MGMFDWIKLEIDCPVCGAKVNRFQSKDGPCILAELEFYELGNFYDICDGCGTRIEFTLKGMGQPRPLSDYEMTYQSRVKETELKGDKR